MPGETTSLEVRTPEGVTFQIPIASPFTRCVALAIDFAIVSALSILAMQLIGIFRLSVSAIPVIGDILVDFGSGALVIFQFAIAILYGIATEWLMNGQTLGKRMFSLRVIDERGLKLGLKQVVIRNLFRLLDSLPSTFYLIGGLSCLFTHRCQRIGDIAAGTLVIREAMATPPALDQLALSGDNSFAAVPHIEARLRQRTSPIEARLALDAVVRRDELAPESRLTVFSKLADHFRETAEFPEEITIGLSDEQYVRNVVNSLFRRAVA